MTDFDFEHLIRNRLKLRHLAVLTAVTDHSSIQKAANQLHMTQPAVSRCIKELETLIGFKLFDRSSKGTRPTGNGDVFVRHARAILAQIRHAGSELDSIANARSGTLVIGCTPETHMGPLPHAVSRLKTDRPGIRVSIVEGLYLQLVPMLENGEIDFLVGRTDHSVSNSGLETKVLFHQRWGVFCRMGHPLTRKRRLHLNSVHEEPWIIPLEATIIWSLVRSIFSEHDLSLPDDLVECSSALFAKEVLASSDRLMLMPETFNTSNEADKAITQLPIKIEMSPYPVGITSVRSRNLTPAQALFRSMLSEITRELGLPAN